MIEHTPAAEAMRRFAVAVATSLHMRPQGHHLTTKLRLAVWAVLAFRRVSKQQQTLLLLADDLLLLGSDGVLKLGRITATIHATGSRLATERHEIGWHAV